MTTACRPKTHEHAIYNDDIERFWGLATKNGINMFYISNHTTEQLHQQGMHIVCIILQINIYIYIDTLELPG